MSVLTILTYLFALALGALALPQAHPAIPDLQLRTVEGCGHFRSWQTGDGDILLLPECANLDGGVYSTRIVNPKGNHCSGEVLWIGNSDHKENHFYAQEVKSYYCKTTFP
ncbi:hypothetical protein P171DRAFT_482790 [Karstenula rhodostoma CBS 690.94]|uniref:Uncharacterized protein n=1 Tax=Karstenula rhodostoma CBS 690.94 TaxID=1392251 RepID=A0A9P4UEZ2_9PLEO|nr:hypothetical protein P171DRAFT_482790 [Karstenula rhodostoma CBS 690.94]